MSTKIIQNAIIDWKKKTNRTKQISLQQLEDNRNKPEDMLSIHELKVDFAFSSDDSLFVQSDEELTPNYLKTLIRLKNSEEDNYYTERMFRSLINYLLATQPSSFINRLPDIKYTYPSKEFIHRQYEYLKDIDDKIINIPGYFRHFSIVNANERYFMLKAIEALKLCRIEFETKLLPELLRKGKRVNDIREKIPLLSAVAVDAKGRYSRPLSREKPRA